MIQKLISDIERHLDWRRAHGAAITETTFGRFSVNDGKLVPRLRAGRQISVETMGRIRAWMASDRRRILAEARKNESAA